MKRRLLALGISGILTLGLGIAAAPSASAARTDCPTGWMCLWDNSNYTGSWIRFEYEITRFNAFGFDNKASSVFNNGRYQDAKLYTDVYYGGGSTHVSRANYRALPAAWNNNLSSGQFWTP